MALKTRTGTFRVDLNATTAATVLNSRPLRKGLIIRNQGVNNALLGFGTEPANGLRLKPDEFLPAFNDDGVPQVEIKAIAETGTTNLIVVETVEEDY